MTTIVAAISGTINNPSNASQNFELSTQHGGNTPVLLASCPPGQSVPFSVSLGMTDKLRVTNGGTPGQASFSGSMTLPQLDIEKTVTGGGGGTSSIGTVASPGSAGGTFTGTLDNTHDYIAPLAS